MKKLSFLILVVWFNQVPLVAQIQTAKLDSLFDNLEKRDLALGNIIILKGKELRYSRSVGFARFDNDKKITSTRETKYKIGSVSKMFTAVMIFQLAEEGKLALNQTLNTFYPGIPNASKITIAHLLGHRSGLHDYTKDTDFENWMTKPKSHEELIQLIAAKGPDFEPGTKAEYCNSNYLLLSYILEKITGLDYEKLLSARITSKLAVKDDISSTQKEHQSDSYKYTNGSWKPVTETHRGIHSGAGDIILTAAALADFTHLLFSQKKFIRNTSLEKMITITDGYGLGTFPYNHGSFKGYGHNGRIEEFYTAARHFPEKNITIVYCTNGINYPRMDILESAVKACFQESFDVPFSKTVTLNDSYPGMYAAEQMPVVTVSMKAQKLVAETQGATFELEPVSAGFFMHPATGYYFEFIPAQNELRIKETDNVYFLKKK